MAMAPSLKQLRYFEAVARFGHYGKAAAHCAVTQPALSMQIQDLERDLGLTLLERRPKGVHLTEAGREIARRAARILSDVRDLSDCARQLTNPLTGKLRFGAIPTLAPYLLPRLLVRLQADYPALEMRVRETQTRVLLDELLDGTLDVVALALPVEHPDLDTLALFEDRFLLALPKRRKISARVRTSTELIAQDRLLLLEEGHCLREQALSYCQLRQVGHLDTFGASSLTTIVQMVANGMGLTLLPEVSVPQETARAEIDVLRFEPPEPQRTIGIAWRRTSPRSADFALLGQMISTTAADILGRPSSPPA